MNSIRDGSMKSKRTPTTSGSVESWLQLAQLRAEKAELAESKAAYLMALEAAKKARQPASIMEAISGLLRLAGEALDTESMRHWNQELDRFIARAEAKGAVVPPMLWYCKGVFSAMSGKGRLSQVYLRRFLRESTPGSDAYLKGWVSLAVAQLRRGKISTADQIASMMLARYKDSKVRGVTGMLHLIRGSVAERNKRYDDALGSYHSANASFLGEHHWYYHLYVLFAYARINRLQGNFAQAYQFLGFVSQAVQGAEFGLLRKEIQTERSALEEAAVDLLIDSDSATIRTRETSEIRLGKQYVLLEILEALAQSSERLEHGLSKSEIIEKVWGERYRPEAHDNKLYYNINRLRRLIEPNAHEPKYLVNWKEGYRLAPGLKVQLISERRVEKRDSNSASRGDTAGMP